MRFRPESGARVRPAWALHPFRAGVGAVPGLPAPDRARGRGRVVGSPASLHPAASVPFREFRDPAGRARACPSWALQRRGDRRRRRVPRATVHVSREPPRPRKRQVTRACAWVMGSPPSRPFRRPRWHSRTRVRPSWGLHRARRPAAADGLPGRAYARPGVSSASEVGELVGVGPARLARARDPLERRLQGSEVSACVRARRGVFTPSEPR